MADRALHSFPTRRSSDLVSGGVGQTFAALLEEKGGNARFFHKAVPDTFVKQASVDSQLRKFGLDKASIVSEVNHAEENPA